ncbi:MAG: DUF2007 domain-containing protein [Bacteroidetes bacterium]|nr:DUF2007 domain-containing protein [Bacteroidota bacterium]
MELITIKESHYPADLLVLKSKLESEGIECFLKDELTSEILSHIPSMSAKLQINSEDLAIVREILLETGDLKPEEITPTCPNCGSGNVKIIFITKDSLQFIVSLLKSLNIFYNPSKSNKPIKYNCLQCKYEFNI